MNNRRIQVLPYLVKDNILYLDNYVKETNKKKGIKNFQVKIYLVYSRICAMFND